MKTYKILVVLCATLFFTSCSDFLDVTKEKDPAILSYFSTEQEATDAVNNVYTVLFAQDDGPFGRALGFEMFGCGDDQIFGRPRDFNQVYYYNFTGRESIFIQSWGRFNNAIARSNWVISNLLKKENLTETEKIRLGEAYFLRGFAHFYIAYRYGRNDQGVPFDRYEDYENYDYPIPEQRATVMDNYQLIIEDLEKAEALVPLFESYESNDYGRVHKAACWAYMVKVYAYWAEYDPSKWDLIPTLVDRIENEGKRGLLDNFSDVFTIANNWSKEYIWSVNTLATDRTNYSGSNLAGVCLENKGWGVVNGWGFFKPTLGLFEEYGENDLRRSATILQYGDKFTFYGQERVFYSASDEESGFQMAKFMEPYTYGEVDGAGVGRNNPHVSTGDPVCTDLNIPIIRFAEMILFKAEALLMKSSPDKAGAAAALNRIATRAGFPDKYNAGSVTMDDLKHERRCELAGEYYDRFKDLKRWHEWDKLNAPKIVRHYENRSDPYSTWTPTESVPSRIFNPETDIALPYPPDDVIKANGKLKQNPIG